MDQSILDSVKKVLGLSSDYDVFDEEILIHINSSLATLNQLGVGPEGGYTVTDRNATWGDILEDDKNYNNVKTYVSLDVKLAFDPPQNSNITNSIKERLTELTWRINVHRENKTWESTMTTT